LSLISMYAETLEMNRVSEEKKKEYYSIIVKETARLAKIVNRILNFSQADADKKKYVMQPVQLNEICSEVLESYSFHLKEAGFQLEFNPEESLPVINADRDSVLEAVINLVDNAMKYSRDLKHIIVNTRSTRKDVLVEIIDRGIGIPKNQHTTIFEQFHRVPSGDVHNTKGSGLGLTLVKKTMEAHHGKVKVESVLGKGSKFQLHFPLTVNAK
jgi:two-component system, OmpR family, phosphate regulon sensor histidine kinase PhoR